MLIARIRQILYFLHQGVKNLSVGGISAIIAVTSITCSLLLICLYFIISSHLTKAFDLEKDIRVVLYLKESVSKNRIEPLQQKLTNYEEILGIKYVSKEKALEKFHHILGEDAIILEGLNNNPLPASFEIELNHEAKEINRLKSVLHQWEVLPEVESVQGGVEWIEKLSGFIIALRISLCFLGGILIIISLFIIASTIHLTIDNRRDEISIMRLVGATDWYIKLPFLFEGVIEGILGGTLAIFLFWVFYEVLRWRITPCLQLIFNFSEINFLTMKQIFIVLLVGGVIGGGGSLLSFFLQSFQHR